MKPDDTLECNQLPCLSGQASLATKALQHLKDPRPKLRLRQPMRRPLVLRVWLKARLELELHGPAANTMPGMRMEEPGRN